MLRCQDESIKQSSQLTFSGRLLSARLPCTAHLILYAKKQKRVSQSKHRRYVACMSGRVISNSQSTTGDPAVREEINAERRCMLVQAMDESEGCTPTVRDAMRRKQRTLGPTAAVHEC